jgi:hypothetical protein
VLLASRISVSWWRCRQPVAALPHIYPPISKPAAAAHTCHALPDLPEVRLEGPIGTVGTPQSRSAPDPSPLLTRTLVDLPEPGAACCQCCARHPMGFY